MANISHKYWLLWNMHICGTIYFKSSREKVLQVSNNIHIQEGPVMCYIWGNDFSHKSFAAHETHEYHFAENLHHAILRKTLAGEKLVNLVSKHKFANFYSWWKFSHEMSHANTSVVLWQ